MASLDLFCNFYNLILYSSLYNCVARRNQSSRYSHRCILFQCTVFLINLENVKLGVNNLTRMSRLIQRKKFGFKSWTWMKNYQHEEFSCQRYKYECMYKLMFR